MDDLGFIHRFVPASAASAQVLVLLHGTGGDENDLLAIGRELAPHAALLSPRGKVLENGQARFFRRFAEGIFDEADVVFRAGELAEFVRAAAERYCFATDRLTLVGYSNGANVGAAMLLLHPDVASSAVLFRAMVPLSSAPAVGLTGRRVLVSAGARDPIVPAESAEALATLMRERGAVVSLEVQNAGHNLVAADIDRARRWLAQAP